MSYIKQNFASGQILKADQLNHIEEGIENIENKMPPENPGAYQQLVTDADGNITWEDKLAYTTKEEQEFIPETTIEKGWTGILTASVIGSAGDRVIVTYNDVVYQGTLNTDNSTIWRVIFDEGVNFPESNLLVCAPGMNANGFSWQVGGTIKATILADKYHTLPSEYLGIAVQPGDDDTSVKIAPDSTGDGEASYYSVSMQSGHATGAYSVALGDGTSEGAFSFAQGSGTAKGQYSVAFGKGTYASSTAQIATGQYNIEDAENKYAHIVGNGERVYDPERYRWNILPSNAHTLDWDGNAWFSGNIKVGGTGQDDETAVEVATKSDIELLSEKILPSVAEPYQQLVTDADGNKKWEDKLAYTVTTEQEIIPSQTATGNSAWYLNDSMTVNPTAGDVYIVEINGEKYESVIKAETALGGFYLGNAHLYNTSYEDTGESFLFMGLRVNISKTAYFSDDGTHTFRVYGLIEESTHIPAKYLPGGIKPGVGTNSLAVNGVLSEDVTAPNSFAANSAKAKQTDAFGANFGEALGAYSFASGRQTVAKGTGSFTQGFSTVAAGNYQHVSGKSNIEDTEGVYAHIVGNGVDALTPSNAHTLDWDGNAWFQGTIKLGGSGQDDEAAVEVATKSDLAGYVKTINGVIPDEDGNIEYHKQFTFRNDSGIITANISGDVILNTPITRYTCEQQISDSDGNWVSYHWTGYKVLKLAFSNDYSTIIQYIIRFNFGDNVPPIVVDCINNTFELDSSWVAPEETATKSDVAALQSSIDTLNGTGEGSVKYTVAESVATIVASAPEDFDTLKEIADWIANDETGTVNLVERVEKAEADIEALKPLDVQADWNQTDETAMDFIKNKPNEITDDEIDAICGETLTLDITENALTDITTGIVYRIYVEDGKLSMKQVNESSSTEQLVFVDTSTDIVYKIYVSDGKLHMVEVG